MGKTSELEEIDAHIADLLEVYKELKKRDKRGEKSLHWYFSSFPIFAKYRKSNRIDPDGNVLESNSNRHALSMLLIYLCMRTEHVHRRILRGVLIKKYKTHKDTTEYITERFYMKRQRFYTLYKKITKDVINKDVENLFDDAYKIRNAIVHGKYMNLDEHQKKDAIISVFRYSELLSDQVKGIFEFEPFGMLKELEEIGEDFDKEETIDKLEKSGVSLAPPPKQPKCLEKCLQE